jgi:predicted DNA-binding transcriptional regulator YafY
MGPDEGTSRWAAEQAERMLDALRYAWGEAYKIWHADDGRWMAQRMDGLGGDIEAGSPEELGQAVFEDYLVKPVPRGLGGGE